ncbi:MAG TPA: toast rack family protein [Terriglobia bacterium]
MFEEIGRSLDNLLRVVSTNLSFTQIDPRTDAISADFPTIEPIKLRLEIGIGTLIVSVGNEKLVEGTATYDIQEWAPAINVEGGTVVVRQLHNLPLGPIVADRRNDWNLKLGTARPYSLNVAKGIVSGELALGGLPLTSALIESGSGKTQVTFDAPNPQRADKVEFRCGSGEIRVSGLLNTNSAALRLSGGTGRVHLGFNGEPLTQDMDANISLGVGESTIVVKPGIPTRIRISQGIGGLHIPGNFKSTEGGAYASADFTTSMGPKLDLKITCGVGSVNIMMEGE